MSTHGISLRAGSHERYPKYLLAKWFSKAKQESANEYMQERTFDPCEGAKVSRNNPTFRGTQQKLRDLASPPPTEPGLPNSVLYASVEDISDPRRAHSGVS